MSTVAVPPPPLAARPIGQEQRSPGGSAWRRWFTRPIKLLLGMVLCLNPLTTLFVVGWTHRSMARLIGRGHRADSSGDRYHASRLLRRVYCDVRHGFAVVANVLLLTLPATSLWYLAWLLGWNVSFFKGYEQSHLGASLGFGGLVLFSLVMLYVPLGICHQTAMASWKSFWDVTAIRRLVWHTGWWHTLLAAVFGLCSLPVMIARIVPYFVNSEGHFDGWTNEQLVGWLRGYYFWASLVTIPAYWFAWRTAAWVYRMRVGTIDATRPRAGLRRLITLPQRIVTAAGLGCAMLLWMTVGFQVFVAQFFNYVPAHGWIVHPVIVMPLLRYIPPELASGG